MKAVLIDPYARTVTDIELPDDPPLSEFYRVIDCNLVELVQLGGGVALVIDEEGMLKDQVSDPSGNDTVPQAYFRVDDIALAGRVVLVKLDEDADSGFAAPGFDAAYILDLFENNENMMAWISAAEKDIRMKARHDAFITMATAAGAKVDDCGLAVVASWGGK